MRSSSLLLAGLLVVSAFPLHGAPTTEQQTTYNTACQTLVTAVNTYRGLSGKAPLTPLSELCQGVREQLEYNRLGAGTNKDVFQRVRDAGYLGDYLTGSTVFYSSGRGDPASLLQRLIAVIASASPALLSDDAEFIGVGFALAANGTNSEFHSGIFLGKRFGGGTQGTDGFESSGRGLLSYTRLREIQAGAWSGDSIDGFVLDPTVVVLTLEQERALNAALIKFAKQFATVQGRKGKPIKVKLPAALLPMIERLALKGKLPAGVRFDSRKGTFSGSAKSAGTYTVTISGSLRGPLKGSEHLKPIRIRFQIGN